jgi:hypothetical protein
VLGVVDFRGIVWFSDFESFFALFLGLPFFMPFVGVRLFPLLDDLLDLFLTFFVFSSWGLAFEL